jgi:hypothetical protein
MSSGIVKYKCNKCKLNYETYNGIWKHNKKYHTNLIPEGGKIVENCNIPGGKSGNIEEEFNNIYNCIVCNKEYNNKYSKYKHQIKCKLENKNTTVTKTEISELKDVINKLETKIDKISNKKVINNYNNCGNMITNNKLIINKIGTENLLELKNTEITDIFNKEIESVILFIELINFNERLPENHSFCTTSLESKYLSTYNSETNTIDKDRKKYFFDKLLDTSIKRLEILYNSNKKKIAETRQKQIEDNISNLKKMKESSFSNKIMKEMINKLNLLSYNKKEIIKNTWAKDESSDDDFQKDLDREDSPRYIEYKKSKESDKIKSNVESSSEFITTDSVAKKVALSLKKTKKPIIKIDTDTDTDIAKQVFIDMYSN